jgi:hypothetical protein
LPKSVLLPLIASVREREFSCHSRLIPSAVVVSPPPALETTDALVLAKAAEAARAAAADTLSVSLFFVVSGEVAETDSVARLVGSFTALVSAPKPSRASGGWMAPDEVELLDQLDSEVLSTKVHVGQGRSGLPPMARTEVGLVPANDALLDAVGLLRVLAKRRSVQGQSGGTGDTEMSINTLSSLLAIDAASSTDTAGIGVVRSAHATVYEVRLTPNLGWVDTALWQRLWDWTRSRLRLKLDVVARRNALYVRKRTMWLVC